MAATLVTPATPAAAPPAWQLRVAGVLYLALIVLGGIDEINGGESFDNSKSFIVRDGGNIKLLYKRDDKALESISVDIGTFCTVVRAFLDWIDLGGN